MSLPKGGQGVAVPAWIVALAILAAAGGVLWFRQRLPAPQRAAVHHREIALRVLAEHLAERFPQSRVLIIGNPFTLRPGQDAEIHEFEAAAVRGFQSGFRGPDAVIVAHPQLRPEFEENPDSVFVDPRTTTPLSFLVPVEAFDKLIATHREHRLVVSLIGLPVGVRQSDFWTAPHPSTLALLLPDWRMIGNARDVHHAFQSGKVAAAILRRPGAPPDDAPAERTDREEFDRRFLLATPENIVELTSTYPQLF